MTVARFNPDLCQELVRNRIDLSDFIQTRFNNKYR